VVIVRSQLMCPRLGHFSVLVVRIGWLPLSVGGIHEQAAVEGGAAASVAGLHGGRPVAGLAVVRHPYRRKGLRISRTWAIVLEAAGPK
jgi:hypothetical protein